MIQKEKEYYDFFVVNSYKNKNKMYRMLEMLPEMNDGFTYEDIIELYITKYGSSGGEKLVSKELTKIIQMFPMVFNIEYKQVINRQEMPITKRFFTLDKIKYCALMDIIIQVCATLAKTERTPQARMPIIKEAIQKL